MRGGTYRLSDATVVIGAFLVLSVRAPLLFVGGHGRVWGLDGEGALIPALGPAREADVCGYGGFDGFAEDC